MERLWVNLARLVHTARASTRLTSQTVAFGLDTIQLQNLHLKERGKQSQTLGAVRLNPLVGFENLNLML